MAIRLGELLVAVASVKRRRSNRKAIGKAGATNAALLAIAILANSRPDLKKKLREFRAEQEKKVREAKLD